MPVVTLVRSVLCGAVILGSLLVSAPFATSAVYTSQQALPAETIQQFLADPAGLLAQYPNGGPQMVTRVEDLAASDLRRSIRFLACSRRLIPTNRRRSERHSAKSR